MWCTIDQCDVGQGESLTLLNDEDWGWIHQNSLGKWHTVTGTRLTKSGIGFEAGTSRPVQPIAPDAPTVSAFRSVPGMVGDSGHGEGV